MPEYILETQRLRLRRPQQSDLNAICSLIDDYDIARSTMNIPHPYVPSDADAFLESANSAWEDGSRYPFSILLKETGEFMGVIGLVMHARDDRAEAGYWIGKPFWGHGYMTEALKRIIEFGFNDLNLNRIQATYFTDNPASGRVMEKVGMSYEGILRQYVRKWDEHKDVCFMALLRDEYGG